MAIRYVAKTGSDGNTGLSLDAAYLTIAKGMSVTRASDTLYIRTGTYNERIDSSVYTIPTGSSWSTAPLISAYQSETVTIRGGSSRPMLLTHSYIQYVIFAGLTFDGQSSAENCIRIASGAHHTRIQDCIVKNSVGQGLLISGGSTTHHHEILRSEFFGHGKDIHFDHGLYITGADNLVEDCDVHDNIAYGVHVYDSASQSAHRNMIRRVKSYDNGEYGILVGSGTGNVVINCLVYNNGTATSSASRGGIQVGFTGCVGTKILNNTVYNNGGKALEIRNTASGTIYKNNIFYLNTTGIDNQGSGTVQSNNLLTNPSFVNAGAGDFHLQAGSAAINTGTTLSEVPTDYDVKVRPSGASYDIGAYEYGSTVVTPPPPATVPAAPSGLSATMLSSSALRVNWTDNANNESGYEIERSLTGAGNWLKITTTGANAVTYTDSSGLTALTTYYYRGRAINAAGPSPYSNIANAATDCVPGGVPAAPSALTASAISSTRIDLDWTRNATDETSVQIERAVSPFSTFALIATRGATIIAYSDTGRTPATEYAYRVRNVNSVGPSAYSNTDNATTSAPPGSIPNAPSDLTVQVISYNQIDVMLADNSSDEDGFILERSIDGVAFSQLAVLDENQVYFSDMTCDALTTYFYRVLAFNTTGDSAYSNITNGTTVALDVEIFDSNQLRSLLGLAPLADGTIGTGEDERHLLDLYRGPYDNATRQLLGPLTIKRRFITLVDLFLDYGTFYYGNFYDDETVIYLPRLIGHGSITEELPDLLNTVLGKRNAEARFMTTQTDDIESPTLAYHAATEDLYSQHALIRIFDLESGLDIMALNAPITSYDIASGQLQIEDDADAIFDTPLPKVRLRDIYPEGDFSTGRGQDPPVIIPFGTMRKVPLYLVDLVDDADGYSNPQYRFGAVRKPLVGTLTWATIYRDGQVVDETEYFEVENPTGYLCIAFLVDQRDTGGRPLPILADLVSSEFGHSPALVAEFLLSDPTYCLGQPVNTASINQSIIDYLGVGERIGGGLWQQIVAKSLIPLVLLHGAYISRNDGNEWILTVDTIDKHSQPTDDVLQLGLGDTAAWQNIVSVQPQHRKVNERLKQMTVKGVWDPDFTGSGTWLVTSDRSRAVTGTVRIIENPYIPDPGTVDREVDYLFTRYAAQDRSLSVQTTTEAYLLELGSLIKVTIPNLSLNEQIFEIRTKSFVGQESAMFGLGLFGWDDNAFAYVPGLPSILPRALVLSDFRRTPPDEPTGFELSGYLVATGDEGHVQCFATFIDDAPANNVTHIVYVAFRAGSGIPHSFIQIAVDGGELDVTGQLEVTPGLYYDYECYALNVDNDADRQESTHAQVLNSLAVGDLIPPLPPTGLTATAGVGRTISLDWNDNTDTDFKTYVVYRSTDPSFSSDYALDGSGNIIGEVRASRMVDQHEIIYEQFYYYRVKAKDLTGNLSGWSNTSVAYVHRLIAPDHGGGTIHTEHRQPFNALVSSVSIPAHTSFSYDTGLDTNSYIFTAGCLGIQATDEWDSFSGNNGTRLFEFVASGPIPGGFDAHYHGGFWNGVNATWNTTVKARGW